VKAISKDINMNFGLEECKKICSEKKKVASRGKHTLETYLRTALKKQT
jgi:hypothetical protein